MDTPHRYKRRPRRQGDKVRAYLRKNKEATTPEVAKATGVSYGYVYRLMHSQGTDVYKQRSRLKGDKVRAYLRENKEATTLEVAKATGVSYGYVYRLIHYVGIDKYSQGISPQDIVLPRPYKKRKSPRGDKVRAYLRENKEATASDVVKATGVSYAYSMDLIATFNSGRTFETPPPEALSEAATQRLEGDTRQPGKKLCTANRRQVGGQHYVGLSVEPWAAMEAWMTKEEFVGFLKGNIIKYIAREKNPNDLDKAGHYMQKLLEAK